MSISGIQKVQIIQCGQGILKRRRNFAKIVKNLLQTRKQIFRELDKTNDLIQNFQTILNPIQKS
jgi:hypothetical protein